MNKELPEDLINEILSRVPIGQWTGRFRCVCKSWLALFSDPSFILREKSADSGLQILINSINNNDDRSVYHLYSADKLEPLLPSPVQLPFNPEKPIEDNYRYWNRSIRIAGSCNGLVFIADCAYDLILWNPATSETKLVPNSPFHLDWFLEAVGFGFDPESDDYKIVRQFVPDEGPRGLYSSEVYCLRTDSWTKLPDDDNGYYWRDCDGQIAQCNKGKLYWLNWDSDGEHKSLIFKSFAMSSHEFQTVDLRLPSEIDDVYGDLEYLLNEEYMVALFPLRDDVRRFVTKSWEVWLLLKYWVPESWTKLFVIANPHPGKMMWKFDGISRNLKWLFLSFRFHGCRDVGEMPLHASSPETGNLTDLHVLDVSTRNWNVMVVNYMPSQISIRDYYASSS
ncbi:unnamed protein product [Linum tenue]|uniref:F-box domain-containing protein n=1 Tax=Linum tenue TaxID=586396 RepID=A0AAV0LW08_9ROSI|nr:unnamed protein product [Linum tenue]